MKLDRKLQKDILAALEEVYPDSMLVASLPGFTHDRDFMGNLFYLQAHGLIEGGDIREPGQCRSMVDAEITKDGLDFLAEDGGLAEILGRLSVTVNSSEVEEAVASGLDQCRLEASQQERILDAISRLRGSELKVLLLAMIRQASATAGDSFAPFIPEWQDNSPSQ